MQIHDFFGRSDDIMMHNFNRSVITSDTIFTFRDFYWAVDYLENSIFCSFTPGWR